MPSRPPIRVSPQGPKLAKVVRVVILVKVTPARKPNGISQRAMPRCRCWRVKLGFSSATLSMASPSGGIVRHFSNGRSVSRSRWVSPSAAGASAITITQTGMGHSDPMR